MGVTDEANALASLLLQMQQAGHQLATASSEQRDRGISALATALSKGFDDILDANTLDLEAGREMAVPEVVLGWLKLTPERLENTIEILKQLSGAPDPLLAWESAPSLLAEGSGRAFRRAVPLGTVAFIYEAFADLAVIAAAMSLKTGNSIVLRGGSETSHTNQVLEQLCQEAAASADLPAAAIDFLSDERAGTLQELVASKSTVALAIVHGRNALVQQVKHYASVPVMPLAMGNCALYWAPSGTCERVSEAIASSHQHAPDAVNAIEKVLVHTSVSPTDLNRVFASLQEAGFSLRGDAALTARHTNWLAAAAPQEWGCPYLDGTIAFRTVDSAAEAVTWIRERAGSHAAAIVSHSYTESRQFAAASSSTLTYINCSPRFERFRPRHKAVYLGISPYYGPVDCVALTRLCQTIEGD